MGYLLLERCRLRLLYKTASLQARDRLVRSVVSVRPFTVYLLKLPTFDQLDFFARARIMANSDSQSSLSGTSSIGSIDSPLSSSPSLFHSRLKPSFYANPSHCSILFIFRTDSTHSPDCLPILLTTSVFYFLVFPFSTFP